MVVGQELLAEVHPVLERFVAWADGELQAAHEFDLRVTSGYRSLTEQAELYELYTAGKGGKAAPAGKSAHNFGLAIDLYPAEAFLGSDGRMHARKIFLDDEAKWQRLGALVTKWAIAHPKEPALKWGRAFDDSPHVELANWEALKDWRGTQAAAVATAAPSSSTTTTAAVAEPWTWAFAAEPVADHSKAKLAAAGGAAAAALIGVVTAIAVA